MGQIPLHLLDAATVADLDLARQALDLITARRANRGRDLQGDFEAYLARWGGPSA